ncbi:ankyrin [Clavulina sp. PMI_390]|nr:ankyrin [Clavulina sp. PMI_390]
MATAPPTTDDDYGTIKTMWKEAIIKFEKSSGKSLNDPAISEIFGNDLTSESIGKALDKCGAGLEKFRNRGKFVLNALKPLLDIIKPIVDPVSDIVQNAGVPGGKIMFVAIGCLLEAIDGVSKLYDNLAEALIQIQGMLSRVKLLCEANAIEPVLRELCVQTLSQVLVIISSFIQYCAAARSKRKVLTVRAKDLFALAIGKENTQPIFTELRRLVDESDRAVNAQTLAGTTQRLQLIFEKIEPTNSSQNQDERLQQGKVVPDHAKWLFDSEMFKGWLETSNGFFWVSANAGVGKSVLCAEVIKHLQKSSFLSKAAIAYHYFDYRVPNKRLYDKFLASIITHFSETSSECKKVLLSAFSEAIIPTDVSRSKLEAVVKSMLATGSSKFLVVDALDECRKEDDNRKLLLYYLQSLTNNLTPQSGDFRTFVTSRPLPDIERALWHTPNKATHRLRLGEQTDHHGTLRAFISTKLDGEDFEDSDWSPSFKEGVANTLIEKSQSMFLWVQLQIELLKGCWQAEASYKLLDLPMDLAATYNRILDEIAVQHRKSIRVLIECIIAANAQGRALLQVEIQEILRFNLIPALDKPKCLIVATTHQEDGVQITLAQGKEVDIFKYLPRALFKIHEEDKRIGFIHFTVQEYLVSDPESANDPRCHFGTSLKDARSTYFLVLMSALESMNTPYFPALMLYADKSWYIHAKSALADDIPIATALEYFLDPNSHSFVDWVKRRYKGLDLSDYRERKASPLHHDHPIHWAVRIGSLAQVKRLCQLGSEDKTESNSDICNIYDCFNWTPLCWAAVCGDFDIFAHLVVRNTSWSDGHIGPFRKHGRPRETASVLNILLHTDPQPLHIPGASPIFCTPFGWPSKNLESIYELHSQSASMLRVLLEGSTNLTTTKILSARDASGCTPILQALRWTQYSEKQQNRLLGLVKVLLSRGANPDVQTKWGKGIAHIACRWNAWILPALISEVTIDVNLSDNDGETPLHVAVRYGSMDTIEALLNAGADPNKSNNKGDGPLDIVVKGIADYRNTIEMWQRTSLEKYKVMRPLLEKRGAQLHP